MAMPSSSTPFISPLPPNWSSKTRAHNRQGPRWSRQGIQLLLYRTASNLRPAQTKGRPNRSSISTTFWSSAWKEELSPPCETERHWIPCNHSRNRQSSAARRRSSITIWMSPPQTPMPQPPKPLGFPNRKQRLWLSIHSRAPRNLLGTPRRRSAPENWSWVRNLAYKWATMAAQITSRKTKASNNNRRSSTRGSRTVKWGWSRNPRQW